jgi:cytochrome c-type biogenesis protein CcmH/NrfG
VDDPAADAYQKGMAYLEKKDLDAAIAAFTEAIRLNPKEAKRTTTVAPPTETRVNTI